MGKIWDRSSLSSKDSSFILSCKFSNGSKGYRISKDTPPLTLIKAIDDKSMDI